jgi:hypothetical protein
VCVRACVCALQATRPLGSTCSADCTTIAGCVCALQASREHLFSRLHYYCRMCVCLCVLQASREHLFSRLHYWLLLSSEGLPNLRLESVYLPLDSHVTVAYRVPGRNETVLRDLYHVGDGQALSVTPPRYWSPELQLPAGPKRTDYGQITLPTVTVVCGVICVNCS